MPHKYTIGFIMLQHYFIHKIYLALNIVNHRLTVGLWPLWSFPYIHTHKYIYSLSWRGCFYICQFISPIVYYAPIGRLRMSAKSDILLEFRLCRRWPINCHSREIADSPDIFPGSVLHRLQILLRHHIGWVTT